MKIAFRSYRYLVSPLFHSFSSFVSGNPYTGCRFEPSCSVYCEHAIRDFGIVKGGLKAFFRICRCHPFSGRGGYDPV